MFPAGANICRARLHPLTITLQHAVCTRLTYVDADCAACDEIIYALLQTLGVAITQEMSALYVALATDTGCFCYANTTAETHRIAAALMETGIGGGDQPPAVSQQDPRPRPA